MREHTFFWKERMPIAQPCIDCQENPKEKIYKSSFAEPEPVKPKLFETWSRSPNYEV